jgi:hypothetical protein
LDDHDRGGDQPGLPDASTRPDYPASSGQRQLIIPFWAATCFLALYVLVLAVLLVDLVATNRLLREALVPGNQICQMAVQINELHPGEISIPDACARILH